MAIIKNGLLFGGWIPTLFGGVAGVWYLTEDKTIKDGLSRKGVAFLERPEEFQKLYYEFESDDSLSQDIPDVANSKGRAISKWCEENLALPLNKENIKAIMPKTKKYCLDDKKITSGITNFNNFEKIFSLINSNEKISRASIVHLGEDESKDTYYFPDENDNLKDKGWTNQRSARKLAMSKKLYLGSGRKLLNTSIEELSKLGPTLNEWEPVLDDFVKHKGWEKLGIQSAEFTRYGAKKQPSILALATQCQKLFNKEYHIVNEEKQYNEDLETGIRWCTENGFKNTK